MSDMSPTKTMQPRRFRVLRSVARVVAVMSVLLVVVRWSGVMESIAFIHPRLKSFYTPKSVEDVWFTTSDGYKLHGWFMPARGRAAGDPGATDPGASNPAATRFPVVMHIHGNEGAIDVHASWSDFLRDRGISVFIFDYRGFGRSQAASRLMTRNDLMRDTRGAFDYLKTRPDIDPSRIGLYGVSLGGAFTLQLAAEHPEIKAVATICTFSSWPGVASDFVPVLGTLLIQTGMAQETNVAHLGKRPLLIVHGDQDTIVSYRHAGILAHAAEAAGVPYRLLTVHGSDHLDILSHERGTTGRIGDFFAESLGVEPAHAAPPETPRDHP